MGCVSGRPTETVLLKQFVIDTNVILHDANCIKNFKEHDVVIPIAVLEELDRFKKGNEDVKLPSTGFSADCRRVNRRLLGCGWRLFLWASTWARYESSSAGPCMPSSSKLRWRTAPIIVSSAWRSPCKNRIVSAPCRAGDQDTNLRHEGQVVRVTAKTITRQG